MNHAPKTANATYSATLCDQLWSDGLSLACIAPGSRSTPLALALTEHSGIKTEVFHDERSAAFAALGYGVASGRPALVLCSSGTAGAHFYAAVIEADASAVPLIVVTADRPPELWNRGAPQTIDQTDLYGTRVRDFIEPGPPDDRDSSEWRGIARRLWVGATGDVPGPVHANLSFRDPLTGTPDALPPVIEALPAHTTKEADEHDVAELRGYLEAERGIIIAGRGQTPPEAIIALADVLGWPVIADHRSGCRDPEWSLSLERFDSLLRHAPFTEQYRPNVVLRLGEIVASKAVSQWLSACAAEGTIIVSGRPFGRHIDPESIASFQFDEQRIIAALGSRLDRRAERSWASVWLEADQIARTAVDALLADEETPSEITIARAALDAVPAGGALVVSSSMPVRDVEWFGRNRSDIAVYANRGANGIDGVVATAIGVALTGIPTVCLIGDVALLHDSASLVALRQRPIDLTIVVINNDGGGIFSFLPQHELLENAEYERLFGTPHGTDLSALVQAHGVAFERFGEHDLIPRGVRVVMGRTDRTANLLLHDKAHQVVAEQIDRRGRSVTA